MSAQQSTLPANQAFVVQFRSKLDLRFGQFEGRAEHIETGEVAHFTSDRELLNFITRMLKACSIDTDGAD